MTSSDHRKKALEQHFVDQAALRLGEPWNVRARESPDFLITLNGNCFGLEVSRVFIGASNKRGSKFKSRESQNGQWLARMLRAFEEETGVPLNLKFRGTPSAASMASSLAALRAEEFALRPLLHAMEREVDGGKIWATRAFVSRCTFLNDTVGWVSREISILQEHIRKKVPKLAAYRANFEDVRLLLVADRTFNSGKLVATSRIVVDRCGFDAVYFYSYPDKIVVCEHVTDVNGT